MKIDNEHFNLFNTIDTISQECAFCDKENYELVIDSDMMTKGNSLLIVTNKEYQTANKLYDGKPKITYWHLTHDTEKMITSKPSKGVTVKSGNFYDTQIIGEIKNKQNKTMIENIMYSSKELVKSNMIKYMVAGSVIVLGTVVASLIYG